MKYLAFVIVPLCYVSQALAVEWGLGFGGISVPHYMGSAEHYQIAAPIPFFLEDKDVFHDDRNFIFDCEADMVLPISGDDINASEPDGFNDGDEIVAQFKNYARRGMGFLPASFYLGLKIGYRFGPLALEMSSTPGVQLGHGWGNAGWINKARLTLYTLVNNSGKSASCLCFYAEALFTNDNFNDLYYSVDSGDALADRPSFDANKSGYLGTKAGVVFVKRMNSLAVAGFLQYEDMNGSIVENSPLVLRKQGAAAAFAIAYMF